MSDIDLLPHLLEIKALSASTAARMEDFQDNVGKRMDAQDRRAKEQNDRIRSLERSSWARGGAIALLAAGWAYLFPGPKGL